ncbi:uncharacterized protein LOC110441256 [Mizuhopecten yessoensis]|uniref:uncharacterized protein LOC110441256 n=1 Tax=Mizuhopecten yessoensis TaxID=6573 RepID=UPI000B45AC83|nr:uncharacterized protein LOC110441256 [Mizuhopecten yessoensis]
MSGREEKDKCSAFLYLIGQDGRGVFNTMTFDGDTRDKIEPLFTKFKEYCQPHENTIVWRHKFNTKVQGKGETIDQYVTELRTISKNCRFGLLTDELIRDRIVCGVNSGKLKERLLRDGELTLIRAITTCRASEESHHMMKNLHGEEVVASVKKSRDYKKTSHKPTTQSSKQYKRVETPRHSNLCGQCGGQHMKGNCQAFGKKCLKNYDLQSKWRSKVTLKSYTGDKIPVAGRCVIPYKDSQLKFYVTDSTHTPLLGFRSSQDLEVIKVELTTNTERKNPVDMYPKLFEGLGCLKESYKIQIDESVTPVVNASRNVPAALRDRLKDAPSEMERDGIIEKVDQPTDWVSSLVVVEKPSGKLRVCLDPRYLDVAIKREHYQLPTFEDIVSRIPMPSTSPNWMPIMDTGRNLQRALDRCQEIGLTLNKEKCKFRQTEVSYIGHRLTQQGVHPDPSKIEAVKDMPQPIDKKGEERLLGFVNYLSKFILNMSTVTEPIRRLLKSDVEFEWTKPQEEAFKEIKKIITRKPELKYFDVKRPITVSCDASKSGLGAVLLQDDQPIAYASRA